MKIQIHNYYTFDDSVGRAWNRVQVMVSGNPFVSLLPLFSFIWLFLICCVIHQRRCCGADGSWDYRYSDWWYSQNPGVSLHSPVVIILAQPFDPSFHPNGVHVQLTHISSNFYSLHLSDTLNQTTESLYFSIVTPFYSLKPLFPDLSKSSFGCAATTSNIFLWAQDFGACLFDSKLTDMLAVTSNFYIIKGRSSTLAPVIVC